MEEMDTFWNHALMLLCHRSLKKLTNVTDAMRKSLYQQDRPDAELLHEMKSRQKSQYFSEKN